MTRVIDDAIRLAALRHDESLAQRDAALDTLALLVDILRREGGYLSFEDQQSLRQARALLVETGRAPK